MAHKNVLILAGGGGHTAYGYALAQRLYNKANLHFLVPQGDKLSYERLNKFGTVDFILKPREAKTPNREFIPKLAKAFAEAFKKVTGGFDVVVSTGSNFCIPPSLSAWIKGIPVINIESSIRFTKASKTAFLLQPFSALTVLQWEEQKKLLQRGVVVGPLIPKPEIEPWNGGYILVTGGTLGHKQLFDAISESNLENVVLQTGKINPEPYRKRHPKWKIIRHSAKFYELIAGASIVVTHFGYTALEAVVYKKPMVMVLNPEWKRTVGRSDAEIFSKKVNAVFVWDVKPEKLLEAIENAKRRSIPVFKDGAEKLAKLILGDRRIEF